VELKIGKNFKYINYIENKILNDKFSPAAAVNFAKQHCEFDISLSAPTIYRYVDMGFFVSLSNDDLAEGKRTIKHNKKNTHKTNTKNPLYESIEQRSEEINSRISFGHWEMDCVVGKRNGKSTSLLVLTERLTRHEIIIKIKTRTASEVVKAINKLHHKYGKRFSEIFKTITVDNGGEFSDCAGIEKGGRTKMFYCHPYTSCERGSNERANRIIRRFIPKGTDISKYTNKDIQRIENWINSYPRKLFHWQCSDELYNNYISVIMQTA
ncbi:MAG: IS30 family transposase, partial [Oscillospiraceae bacterium]